MNFNQYDETINGKDTFTEIADKLVLGEAVIIGWTDEETTHYDIFFKLRAYRWFGINTLQSGIKQTDLFIGIIGHGLFGFKTDDIKSYDYIAEKLRLHGEKKHLKKVAELINGIVLELKKYDKK